jgi:gas vesicle protein
VEGEGGGASVGAGGNTMKYFLAGFSIGAIAALVFAPASGEETRQQLSETTNEILKTANESIQDLKKIVQGAAENKTIERPGAESQAS